MEQDLLSKSSKESILRKLTNTFIKGKLKIIKITLFLSSNELYVSTS